jgi:dTMP kinase
LDSAWILAGEDHCGVDSGASLVFAGAKRKTGRVVGSLVGLACMGHCARQFLLHWVLGELVMLVVLEGIDGTGKATQTKLLAEKLRAQGFLVTTSAFPRYGMGHGAEQVSRYLRGDCGDLDPYAAAMFYAVDRLEHRGDLIGKLNTSDVVIVDRYVGSNLAHQSARVIGDHEKQVHLKRFIMWLEYQLYKMPQPDVQILLSTTEKTAESNRVSRESDDVHERDGGHQQRALAQYKSIAAEHGWLMVSTVENGVQRSPDEISQNLYEHVMRERIYKTGKPHDVNLLRLATVIFGDLMVNPSEQRLSLCIASAKRAMEYVASCGEKKDA